MKALKLLKKHRLQHSYWGKIIIYAEWYGEFTEEDREEASEWKSCACGKLDDHIDVDEDGAPTDSILIVLGAEFYQYVRDNKFIWAAKTLIQIEQRSIELLGGDR